MKKQLQRAGLMLASTLVSLAFAEAALHYLNIGTPILRDVDPIFGWAPIAGAEGVWTSEGRARVQITEHGFRGVDHPRERPEGVFRIAVLGDSFTEAKQVALDDAYPSHVERALASCEGLGGRRPEVLSFGVSGYGTAQEALVLEHRVWRYQPDLVVLGFLTGNDIADNHPELRANGHAPFYRLEEGELLLDTSFLNTDWYRSRRDGGTLRNVRRRSRLWQLLGGARSERSPEAGLRDEIYAAPTDPRWADAWLWTEAILEQMSASTAAHGAAFGVVTLSNAIQVHPDPEARRAYREGLQVDDLRYPDRRVAAVGERAGFPTLELVPHLREVAEQRGEALHGFPNTQPNTGHWNEEGHRVAGEHIAQWLCEHLVSRE